MINEPAIALDRPPVEPGAGWDMVKMLRSIPPIPWITSDHRMNSKAASAMIVASPQSVTKMLLTILRCSVRPIIRRVLIASAGEQRPGRRKHREGDDEQDQAERDQSGGVHVAGRLGELVGDGRGDGRSAVEQRMREAVRIADDEG